MKDQMTYSLPGKRTGRAFIPAAENERRRKKKKKHVRTLGQAHARNDGTKPGLYEYRADELRLLCRAFERPRSLFSGTCSSAVRTRCRTGSFFTHTFITPQVNRSQMGVNVSPTPISAKVVDKMKRPHHTRRADFSHTRRPDG